MMTSRSKCRPANNSFTLFSLPKPILKIHSSHHSIRSKFAICTRAITATFHVASQNVRYADLDFFNPQPVTPNDDTRTYTGAIIHRLAFGEALLQSTFSVSEFTTAVTPQGDLGMIVAPGGNGGNYFGDQQRHSRRLEWNELWSLKPINGYGIHKIQVGSSFSRVADEGQLNAKTITCFDKRKQMY